MASELILVATTIRNEFQMLPWFVNHYNAFASKIIVYDDHSDDGSREYLSKFPIVEVRNCPFWGMDEPGKVKLAREFHRGMEKQFDWVMFTDCDEFIYAKELNSVLYMARTRGYQAVRSVGYNMHGNGLPMFDGEQLWQKFTRGWPSRTYSKTVVFRPGTDVDWEVGLHHFRNPSVLQTPDTPLKLLHYRWLGFDYAAERNRRNFERSADKKLAWIAAPEHTGKYSPHWAAQLMGGPSCEVINPPDILDGGVGWNQHAFCGDQWVERRVREYVDFYHPMLIIETGTQNGFTTASLANMVNEVWSIEIDPVAHARAKENLVSKKNVRLHCGESSEVLGRLLKHFPRTEPLVFFLDAHGFGQGCALKNELRVIQKHRRDAVNVIVIHDCQVPDRPGLGFDTYDGEPINIASVWSLLEQIYPSGYSVRYNDIAEHGMRGCAFITPRQ